MHPAARPYPAHRYGSVIAARLPLGGQSSSPRSQSSRSSPSATSTAGQTGSAPRGRLRSMTVGIAAPDLELPGAGRRRRRGACEQRRSLLRRPSRRVRLLDAAFVHPHRGAPARALDRELDVHAVPDRHPPGSPPAASRSACVVEVDDHRVAGSASLLQSRTTSSSMLTLTSLTRRVRRPGSTVTSPVGPSRVCPRLARVAIAQHTGRLEPPRRRESGPNPVAAHLRDAASALRSPMNQRAASGIGAPSGSVAASAARSTPFAPRPRRRSPIRRAPCSATGRTSLGSNSTTKSLPVPWPLR